ncbi:MAG: hypothetical protein JWM64_839 [Frankiales bacterium]|nr:hypothetical protein [Frankiales bacterium]
MVYAYEQDVPIDVELYTRIIDNIGPEPLAGLLVHLCVVRPDGGLRYLDVWASEQQCAEAFERRIHPAVAAAFGSSTPMGEPEVRRLDLVHASGALTVDLA